jgi:hypothetical protein
MADVEREASLLAAAGPEADRPAAPARGRRLRLPSLHVPRLAPVAVAAALLLVGAGIGIGVTELRSGPDRTIQAKMENTAGAERANAEVEINGDDARLVARGLPAPPSGRLYQVWLKRDGHAPEPTAALFKPNRDGTATASVPGSLEGVDQVMVTDEPDGGSPQPTGDLLLVANVS